MDNKRVDAVDTNPKLYDGECGKLTMAVLERLDYMKEYFPVTAKNVDAFEKGFARYSDKIEKIFQEYWETLSEEERQTTGVTVGKMLDQTNSRIRKMVAGVRRQHR